MSIEALNKQFGIKGQVEFSKGQGSLTVVTITNKYATAIVSLYGAHVLGYVPKGEEDLLWMSSKSAFEEGSPIRGGIPVCFPWFGPHPTNSTKPQHGFARLLNWDVDSTITLADGGTELVLTLKSSAETKAYWPYSFTASMKIIIGKKLDVGLTVTNTGDEAFEYTDALHTYINVSDIDNLNIDGLSNSEYYIAMDTIPHKQSELLLTIAKEENRRYLEHTQDTIIYDTGFSRKLRVAKTGSKVTVVWNPGAETSKKMADLPATGYKTFICVEAANAVNDVVKLAPGKSFTMSTIISAD